MPKFILLVMLGVFPDGNVTLAPFTDRTGCDEAMQAITQIIQGPHKISCYDTYLGMIVSRQERR